MANPRWPRSKGREQEWRGLIGEWRESGQSVVAFCRRRGLTASAFYYWRTQLKKHAGAQVGATGQAKRVPEKNARFVPVSVKRERIGLASADKRVSPELEDGGRVELVIGKWCIRVGPAFDPGTLAQVVEVLEARGC